MGQDPTERALREVRRRSARELMLNGILTREEHAMIERSLGPRTARQKLAVALPWLGYAALILAAVAEVASVLRPELRGPLEQLVQIVQLVTGAQ